MKKSLRLRKWLMIMKKFIIKYRASEGSEDEDENEVLIAYRASEGSEDEDEALASATSYSERKLKRAPEAQAWGWQGVFSISKVIFLSITP